MSETERQFNEDYQFGRGWFIPESALSDLAAALLDDLIASAKHGGSANLTLRVDAVETRWEADWIKYARRPSVPKPIGGQHE